jgi:glucan phosphoethanolaminetransferase (alkaline phosphatase superfamily)
MANTTSSNVRKSIAYILSALILVFSIISILAIWDIIDYDDLVKRMFQSLMVILATSAVIVLIFAILDRPERDDSE